MLYSILFLPSVKLTNWFYKCLANEGTHTWVNNVEISQEQKVRKTAQVRELTSDKYQILSLGI